MRVVIQRASRAKVEVEGKTVGEIGRGFLILCGVIKGDADEDARYLAKKVAALRIFNDDAGKMNLSLSDVGGAALVVSQFTLAADTRRGNRPGFDRAAPPDEGKRLYELFAAELAAQGIQTATGVFQAHMDVTLTNVGPVTIIIDSAQRNEPR